MGCLEVTLTRMAVLVALGLAFAIPGACFSLQEPACAFTCVQPPHACPTRYTCGSDGLCHRDGADAACPFTAPEGGLPDRGTHGGDGEAVPDGGAGGAGGTGTENTPNP